MPHIRKATLRDAVRVAPLLRQADRDECLAFLGLPPELILPINISQSDDTWAMVNDDGEPFGLFGVSPVHTFPEVGIVWMCSTPELVRYKRELIQQAPEVLNRLHARYPLLTNHIDARNKAHIQWLKRMGFSFLRELPEFGVEKRPFYEFARLKCV